ncbi:MAG: MFS transporter [Syntrophobacteraceae bacterium]
MAFANFLILSNYGSFLLFPIFVSEHGGDKADIGIIMGTFVLASVLCRPFISDMVDQIGRKKSFTLGCLIMTLIPLAYIPLDGKLASFYLPLLAIRLLHGVGLAVSMTAAFTYAADIIPENRRSEGIGIFGISGLVGSATGPVIAEFLIHKFGFSTSFVVAAVMSGLALLIQLPLRESFVPGHRERSISFFEVLKMRKIVTVSMVAFLFGIGLAGCYNFVTPFAHELLLPLVSFYFVAYSSASVLTRVIGRGFTDRVGVERIIPYALALSGGGLLLMIALNGNVVLTLGGILAGCGHGFLYPSLGALAMLGEPTAIRGKIVGIFTGAIDAGSFIGSFGLGYIGELAGFRTLFLVAGVALFLAIAVFRYRSVMDLKLALRAQT